MRPDNGSRQEGHGFGRGGWLQGIISYPAEGEGGHYELQAPQDKVFSNVTLRFGGGQTSGLGRTGSGLVGSVAFASNIPATKKDGNHRTGGSDQQRQ